MEKAGRKDALRQDIVAARLAAAPSAAADADRTRIALSALGGLPPGVLAAYLSIPPEPDTRQLISEVVAAGWRVLLPKLRRTPAWAWFTSWEQTTTSCLNIPEPSGEPLGPETLGLADVVIAPCLGYTSAGIRLGTGGGWYDRALLHRRSDVPVWVLANTSEQFFELPQEAHDVPVQAAITQFGFQRLGTG